MTVYQVKISPFTEARTAHFQPLADTHKHASTHAHTQANSPIIQTLNKQTHWQKPHSRAHTLSVE